jgi:hypothetical protein
MRRPSGAAPERCDAIVLSVFAVELCHWPAISPFDDTHPLHLLQRSVKRAWPKDGRTPRTQMHGLHDLEAVPLSFAQDDGDNERHRWHPC